MNRIQLEIGFDQPLANRHLARRQRRLIRARWWFEQMRRVVDHTIDLRPAPVGPPEQIHMPLHRTLGN